MKWFPFAEIVTDATSKFKKIKASDYLSEGQYKIIDQGKGAIAGYTDDKALINPELLPIIIFGDHTRALKYEDTPIALGADGAKALKIDLKLANTLYVYYYLRSVNLKDAGYSRHFKFLKEIVIPLPVKDGRPNLDDQIRVVHLLSKVEGLIAQRKHCLQQLDELLKSVFLEMFGDLVRNEKRWNERSLGTIFKVKHGFAFKSEFFKDSGRFVLLTPGNFFEKGGFRDRVGRQKYYVGEAPKEYILSEHDLLLAMTEQAPGLLGSPLIVPESRKYLHNQRLGLVSANEPIQVFFLFHLFNQKSIRQIIHSKATGTKVRHTSPTKLESIVVGYPPLELQNEFAAIVEKVEGIKSRYQQSLSELENLYGTLSQKAFKGELELSRVPLPNQQPNTAQEIAPLPAPETSTMLNQPPEVAPIVLLDVADVQSLADSDGRHAAIKQWLEGYLNQVGDSVDFSLERFMVAVNQKLQDVALEQDGEDAPLTMTDYDQLKARVFAELASGKLSQGFDDDRNRIDLHRSASRPGMGVR